jgi:tRNA (adenine22-N1)-methyltransferase
MAKFEIPALSPRLEAVASLAMPCDRLYDIGTDHAFLPIHLFRRGLCQRAVASDIRPGPIEIARRNIRRAGLQNRIETAVTYGLDGYPLGPDDIVIMAGLGGLEMIDILEKSPCKCRQIILQPQKSALELRLWLWDNQYRIVDERIALDRGRLYVIISCSFDDSPGPIPADPAQRLRSAAIGPILIQTQPDHFVAYLRQLESHLHKARRSQPALIQVHDSVVDLLQSLGCKMNRLDGERNLP